MSIQAVIKNVVGAVAGDHGEPDPLLAAGTVLAVGQCRVIPERFLSEGMVAQRQDISTAPAASITIDYRRICPRLCWP